jgi:hypothetical protein
MPIMMLAALLAALVVLSACGGGGSSAGETVPAANIQQPAPPPVETPPPTPPPAPQPEPPAPEPEPEPEDEPTLVGLWEWADDFTFRYTFNADGTGIRGFGHSVVAFEWYADYEAGYLDIYVPGVVEQWSFLVYEDVLIIESLQVPGMAFAYVWTGDVEDFYFPLAGIWTWVDDFGNLAAWDYVFFSDGSGLRGTTEVFDIFYWETDGDYFGILYIYVPSAVEEWDFTLQGDTLTVSSPDLPGVRLIYNRID